MSAFAKTEFFDVLELRVGVEFVLQSSLPSTPVTSLNVFFFIGTAEWRNGGTTKRLNGGTVEQRNWLVDLLIQAERRNGRNGYLPNSFMVHAAADVCDTDTF
jgi:hypothetical protein